MDELGDNANLLCTAEELIISREEYDNDLAQDLHSSAADLKGRVNIKIPHLMIIHGNQTGSEESRDRLKNKTAELSEEILEPINNTSEFYQTESADSEEPLEMQILQVCIDSDIGSTGNQECYENIPDPEPTYCANCRANIPFESMGRKNFHEFLPLQYFDTATGDYSDVQLVDAIAEIFKVYWTCDNYNEIRCKADLELCVDCASILAQLYKLYNKFSALAVKNKSYLFKIINFRKDVRLLDQHDGEGLQDDENESTNRIPEDEQLRTKTTWKRSRKIKKVKKFGFDAEINPRNIDKNAKPKTVKVSAVNVKQEKESASEHSDSEMSSLPISQYFSRSTRAKRSSNRPTNITLINKVDHDAFLSDELEDSMPSELNNEDDDNDYEPPSVQNQDHDDDEEDDDDAALQKYLLKKLTVPLQRMDVSSSTQRPHYCQVCTKGFKSAVQLNAHQRSKYHKNKARLKDRGSTDGKTDQKNVYVKKVLGIDKANPKTCDDCGKAFTKSKNYIRHCKTAHIGGTKGGQCDRCNKNFTTAGGLKIHYASHVRDDNKLACKDCGKRFRRLEALELHERTDHGGFKPHVCSQCDKRFRLKDKLKLHVMVIHEKRKPFPCPKCEKSFRTKYHLKIHDVSQHIQGGDTAIGCSQCKRKFSDREALEKHVLAHDEDKPFICSVCGKGFQSSARLKLHEKSHQEVPSCLCPVCGRAYKHIRDLKLHEVVHQDESTYRFGCGDCPRRFYRIDLLRVHQSNEKHFQPEVVGPTVTKAQGPSEASFVNTREDALDDHEEEDENETDSELHISSPPQKCRKRKIRKAVNSKKNKMKTNQMAINLAPIVPSTSTGFQHSNGTTVIYQPQSVLQLHMDPNTQGTPVFRNSSQSATNLITSGASSLPSNLSQPRSTTVAATSSSYFLTQQRDRQNHVQIQGSPLQGGLPLTGVSHPHIQFSNGALYSVRGDAVLNPNINVSPSSAGAEPIGYDIITSFINNLGPC